MELYLEFYKVLNKTQSLYNPIFLQDLVLTTFSLDYPMAPSVTCGDSSLPEGAEKSATLSFSPRREPRGTVAAATEWREEQAPPLRGTEAALTLPPSGREVARLSREFFLRLSLPHRGAVTEGACGWWNSTLIFIGSLLKINLYIIQSFYKTLF